MVADAGAAGYPVAVSSGGNSFRDFGNVTKAPDPLTAFVTRLYAAVLDRAPDPDGLSVWVGQLQAGLGRDVVTRAVWGSPEHRGLEVDHLYATVLHRAADADGRAAFVSAMMAGATESDVEMALLTSPEYLAAHAGNAALIQGYYADILGRTVTSDELTALQSALQAGVSPAGLAQALLNSAEGLGRLVDADYQDLLHRVADGAGRATWLSFLESGFITPDTARQLFLATDEFFALAGSS
jgi:hypothetical protein